ncbi:hypothetical protein ACIQTZ_12400 [Paenarthrobacter sp. NPDC090520]|uniref:hypothetical protein n=1 Tax=Paenarthrobacter sp. NPDC090520 TaxID=3364382 RepID=UPI00381AEEAF
MINSYDYVWGNEYSPTELPIHQEFGSTGLIDESYLGEYGYINTCVLTCWN